MKKLSTYALAIVFIVASNASSVWATSTDKAVQEECQAWVMEQQPPAEDVEQLVADCVAVELDYRKQESIEEECRTLATEQNILDDEIEQFVNDCIAQELGPQEEEMNQEEAEQPAQE